MTIMVFALFYAALLLANPLTCCHERSMPEIKTTPPLHVAIVNRTLSPMHARKEDDLHLQPG